MMFFKTSDVNKEPTMSSLKNFIRNFKYMAFSELRVFYVVVVSILVALSWFLLATTQSKNELTVTKIAKVNQEIIKLTQTSTSTQKVIPLLDDKKVASVYDSATPQSKIKAAVKDALDYSDGKTLLDHFNTKKGTITGNIWSINAPDNTFTSSDWQAKADLGNWSQSIIITDVLPSSADTFIVVTTIQPQGSLRENKQPITYWLSAKINGDTIDCNITNQVEVYN